VAIYHLHAKPIQRSKGESSVAASAYRSASCITDERTGITHDYTRKQDVLNSEILLPKNAPETFADRATLWNTVEAHEKRKDAQPAREINIALPRELSFDQNWQLAKDFVQKEFVDKGMIADVAFHRGHGGPDEEQPHMHVMLTMREVTPEGFGPKVREWNRTELLLEWRRDWAEYCNHRLALLGIDASIDHRSNKARGINLEPNHYRNGMVDKRTGERQQEYEEVARRNGERLLEDPSIALHAITQQQSTFSHHDVARFINRNSVDNEQFEAIYAKVLAHEQVVSLGRDNAGRERYSTQDMLALEKEMLARAQGLNEQNSHSLKANSVDAAIVSRGLSDEQGFALRHITQGQDLETVVGIAGSGKSYMLGAAREVWEDAGYIVQGAALSGIAAQNLQEGAGIKSHTIANRLWTWGTDRENLTSKHILVIDEAGMVGSKQMNALLAEAERGGAKVVLVGDYEQLQAIDAGAAFRGIVERTGFAQMSEIRRQKVEWQKEATRDFFMRDTAKGLMAYDKHDRIHGYETRPAAIDAMIARWDTVRTNEPDKTQIMFAFRRDEVKTLNETAREIRRERGELGMDNPFMTANGERNFAEGDRVYFLKNENKEMMVKNGTLGTISKIDGREFRVKLDNTEREVSFNLKNYNNIDHGYAATVHKSQGVTVDYAQVLASRHFDNHTTYVSMSRHRDNADLYYSRDEFPNFGDLSRSLSRKVDKDITTDYSLNRNCTPDKLPEKEKVKERENVIPKEYQLTPAELERGTKMIKEDHAKSVEERIERRLYEKAVAKDVERAAQKTGLDLNMNYKAGEQGIYRGTVEIAGRSYGIMEKENKEGRLIPAQQLNSREKGELMKIEQHTKANGREELKAVQPKVQERQKAQERDMDQGISY